MSASLTLTIGGFLAMVAGLALQFGVGWALLVGGALSFIAGGLGSAREAR